MKIPWQFNSKVHPSERYNCSVCKDDGSRNNWPSASATADVRLIPWRHSSSRFLCFIEATNFVTASSEGSVKERMLSVCKVDNSGSNWPSASATVDVRSMLLSSSFSIVLFLITSIKLNTPSEELSVKPRIFSVDNDNHKVHPSDPRNSSVCKNDGSRNNWPSASGTADVRLIPSRYSWTRFLCLKEATNCACDSLILSLGKGDNSEDTVQEPKGSPWQGDNTGSNWPGASAAADVTFILLSSSFSRVSCLIAATNFIAASSEHSFKKLMLTLLKADKSGNNWPRASANVDVTLIALSSTSSTGLCLKPSESLVIAFAAFSVKPVIVSVPNDEM